ncbi:uncharacterized protein LOC116619142 [Nematostella vectensis]|uniref:uncharacterized protein LOC116619142 n=1 Tax=Nematostella vectensis TaxID=45351 RepID=UPI00138FD64B|nr:uncharacterized protein LOC116619142 [Nematostella vectensis]
MNSIPVLLVLLGAFAEIVFSAPARDEDLVYTTIDCPVGIWVCQKRRSEIAQPVRREPRVDCPPGVWTCQKKREEAQQEPLAPEAIPENAVESDADNLCPPGVWTCGSSGRKKRQAEMPAPVSTVQEETERSINMCPPGIWVCDRKRELKRQREQRRQAAMEKLDLSAFKKVKKPCPPGIWVC